MATRAKTTNRLASRMRSQSNITQTENGAKTYRSTTNAVLDFFYLAPTSSDPLSLFQAALEEDPILALKAAFYLRDARGGKGRRQAFRDILSYLATYESSWFNAVVPFVPEYGRWDDILGFINSKVVRQLVWDQLQDDKNPAKQPTLLAKWMPSENASSRETVELAREWAQVLDLTPRAYRKTLTDLRLRIGIVENYMSHGAWEDINYSHVPSRAMKLYRKAFERNDPERFTSFVTKAVKGEVKIQSRQLYPHEIVAEFTHGSGRDDVLEAQWNQLPNFFGDEERNVLVVVDTSSSMQTKIGQGKVEAIDVSVGLGLYCAERNRGAFQNLVMTFNTQSEIVEIKGKTLQTRVNRTMKIPWGGTTNLQDVFLTLLRYAKAERVKAKDMPTNIIIITDGEFDIQVSGNTNFEGIKDQYKAAKYPMPILTFWNVDARHNQAPVIKSEKNVFLVGGFSAETIGKVLNAEATTPEGLMLEVLNSERYSFVDSLEL